MQIALTDESGPVPFELSSYNLGDHRIHLDLPAGQNAFDEEGRETITVPGLRLDDVEELEVEQNTLLFVDVQGFEGQVLAGAPRALRACPPLVVELWPYGLDRAGGRQALFDGLTRYERFYDLKASPPRLFRHDELTALAASIAGNPLRDTDILALGH